MSENTSIKILIAEDNDVSRNLMAGVLRGQGFEVIGAVDGESAIKVVQERPLDLIFVDINMEPMGGFDFMRYLIAKGIKIPVVIVTAGESADMLMEANALGAALVLQKPIVPERLIKTVHRICKSSGLMSKSIAVEAHEAKLSPEELMRRAIELAAKNARRKMGGPYGAVLADADGKIVSEGVNGAGSRADPTAHAEVMAIRLAADKLGMADLSDYVLYCSSEPTNVGKSLILSVGIQIIYCGLSMDDIGDLQPRNETAKPKYKTICRDEALEMFKLAQDR